MSRIASSMAVVQSTRTGFVGSDLRNVVNVVNALVRAVAYQAMPGVVLTAPANKKGTSAETAWRTEAFTFTFRGKEVAAAAQEKALTATTHDVAASKEAWFALSVQSDGSTFTVTKGADQTPGTRVLPVTPDNEVLVGLLQIVTGAGGIFDASSADIETAANVTTVAFYDPAVLTLIGDESETEMAA